MAAIYDILSREEFIAFSATETDRAKAVVLAAIVENHLTSAIKMAFHKDETIWNELFRPSGPIGDFGTKIKLAYMAGIITDARLKNDLVIVSRIRNRFAHDLTTKTFKDQSISALIQNMYSYTRIKQIAAQKPEAGDNKIKRAYIDWMSKVKRKALRSMRATYIECLGMILHELIVNVEDENRAKSEGTPKRDYPFGSSGAGKMDVLAALAKKRRKPRKSKGV